MRGSSAAASAKPRRRPPGGGTPPPVTTRIYWGAFPHGNPYSIAATFTRAGTVATATTGTPHGYVTGNSVNVTGTTSYNGVRTLTSAPTTTSFTFNISGTPAGESGTVSDSDFPIYAGSTAYTKFTSGLAKLPGIIPLGGSWVYSSGAASLFNDLVPHCDRAFAVGAIPMVSWLPAQSKGSAYETQPLFRTRIVGDGVATGTGNLPTTSGTTYTWRSYVDTYATQAAAYNKPIFLRLGHEMNGNWYPWADGTNGNVNGDYVYMWQQIYTRFSAIAPNVTWYWCPNFGSVGAGNSYAGLYPGNLYVDWVGGDGYNKGTFTSSTSFAGVLNGAKANGGGPTVGPYSAITALGPGKPFLIGETGTTWRTDLVNDKANWITDMLSVQLPTTFPAVKGIIYYNDDEYPAASNNVALEQTAAGGASPKTAFATAIAGSYYASNEFGSLANGKIQPL